MWHGVQIRAVLGAAALGLAFVGPAGAAADRTGIVLMHGEMGAPGRVIADLGAALEQAGYLVLRPDMCWSARRGYEAPFSTCLSVVDDAIIRLRNLGATSIVVGGFSLGATAAIVYGAAHPDLLGVLALAPAHDAATLAALPDIAAEIAQARARVAAGQGDDQGDFDDVDVGPAGPYRSEIATTPSIYLSFFGSASPATIAPSVAHVAAPLLWIAGADDAGQPEGRRLFALAPPNPDSRFVVVAAPHLAVPARSSALVLPWLRDLARHRAASAHAEQPGQP